MAERNKTEEKQSQKIVKPKSGAKKGISKKIITQGIVIIVFISIMVLVLILITREKEVVKVIPRTPVFVTTPGLQNIENYYKVNGNLESEVMLTILPKISGALVKLYVDIEDKVEKGQVVAELDREPYELQLKQAEAAYWATKSTWNRIEQLYQSGGASKQQYEEVRAKFNATEAQYNLARLQLSYTKIRSDVSGVVLKRHDNINTGMLVAPQVPIFTIGQPDKLIIKAMIPEYKYKMFDENRDNIEIRLEIPAINRQVSAVIDRISPYIEPQSKSFQILCKINDPDVSLPPGMSVRLSFVTDSRSSVFTLPRKALVGGEALWIAEKQVVKGESGEDIWQAQKLEYQPPFANNEMIMVEDAYKDTIFIIDGHNYLNSEDVIVIKNPEVLE